MAKEQFTMPQPQVRTCDAGDRVYVFICLNEEMKEIETHQEEYGSGILKETVYEYDYNTFTATHDMVDDIVANPSRYIDYVLKEEKTIESRVTLIEEDISGIEAAIKEVLNA